MSRINPLRKLYNFLSEQLSEDDERSLRNLLRNYPLTTRELEHLNSPAEIFIKLEETGHISMTDLVLLKQLLREIKRLPLVVEVERVEKELQESNELKIKSTGCLGAEGGDVAASRAVDIKERGKMMMNMTQDHDGNTTKIQHHIDKDNSYNLPSSLAIGLQQQISLQGHISSTERKEDLPQDVKYDQFINSAASNSATSMHGDKDVILKCQEKLRKEYKRLSHILPLPWLDGAVSRLKLEDIYTELDLQTSDGTKQVGQREDIFSCSDDDENPKRILIEGEPGYGKSTFCKMIAYDWAKNKTEYLRNFKLLFLLELKDLQDYHNENKGKESLKYFIFDTVLRDVKEREALWSFIENNQSQVCFIFDGLDEVSSSNPPSYFKQMVQQKWPLLPDCHVIVTSRIIRDADSKSMYDKKLSIKGLHRAKVEVFVKNYLKCHVSTEIAGEISCAEGFVQEVRGTTSQHILHNLMQSPLNALMLCEILKQTGEVPQFITEIYEAIVKYMVKRYCENIREGHTFNETAIEQTLLFLGKKSHEGLLSVRGQLFLSEDEIKSYPHILKLGFLSKPSTSSKGYSFFHRTFQEYFAALYIADLCPTNPSEFADIIDVSDDFCRKSSDTTLVFVAGLLKHKQIKMFEIWYRKRENPPYTFDHIYILSLQNSGFVTKEIISLCAKVLPRFLLINITDLENHHNKLEITKRLLQCSDIRSETICFTVSASNPNPNTLEIYSSCRAFLKTNLKKLEVQLKIDCDLSECAIKHLEDIALASDSYTNDAVSLHIGNHGNIDVLRSIPNIVDAFSNVASRKRIITGIPFRLDLIDAVLLKLNNINSSESVSIVFDEHKNPNRWAISHARAVQIILQVGKFKIFCNVDDLTIDLVSFKRLLECYASGAGDRITSNINIKFDFRIEAFQTYVEKLFDSMKSFNIDDLELDLLSYTELDIKKTCPQIDVIMKCLSSISARKLTIKGFPVDNLELMEKTCAELSDNESLKSIHVVFLASQERYKVHIDAKFGKFCISHENPSRSFDLLGFSQLFSKCASLNDTALILDIRVTCAVNAIGISNIHDIIRKMESVPMDSMTLEFSDNEMQDLTDVYSRLISLMQTLSQISAIELVIKGIPLGDENFIIQVHKAIVTKTSSVRVEFREKFPNMLEENLKIKAKVRSFETSFKINDLNFDLSRLRRLLSELACYSTVSFDIEINCDFRQNDVDSFVKNVLARIKSVDINELTVRVSGYANSDMNDVRLCINIITKGFEDICAEQVNIQGLSHAHGHVNFVTLLCQAIHHNISLKKVCISFSLYPAEQLFFRKADRIIADFGKFSIVYELHHLTFELQSLCDTLSHQASLNNEKLNLSILINCDFNDRELDRYMKDAIFNMKAIDITQITFNVFSFTAENAHRLQNIFTNIGLVKMQKLLVYGIPFGNLDVFKSVSEPFTKLTLNTVCYFLSRPTCPTYCKLNLLQHSSVIAHCKTRHIKLRICKATGDLVDFYRRFLPICLPESHVKIDANVSYDGNRQQANSDIQYLLAGNKSLRFGKLSFLDRCNYSKLSVEGRDTIDVLKAIAAMNTQVIRYENCPSIDFKFSKSVLDIMLRSQSLQVAMSFREKMNRSRILDTIKSFENDGLVIHLLQLTSRGVSVQGKYINSPISTKFVTIEFATGHILNNDFPGDDIKADTSPFREHYDLPNFILGLCGIKSSCNTVTQSQPMASTASTLSQYVSALVDLTALDVDVSMEENIQLHLAEIMMKDSLRMVSLKGCDLNKMARCIIDCIKERDRVKKNLALFVFCPSLDSANVTMLTESLETDGFVKSINPSTSDAKYAIGWRSRCIEILFFACNKGDPNPEEYPRVETELFWWFLNVHHNYQNTYGPDEVLFDKYL